MLVSLDDVKNYLRVEFDDDNSLITTLIEFSEKQVKSILRFEDSEYEEKSQNYKPAILYSVAYLYENREEANHNELNIILRAILFSGRKADF